MAAVALCGAGCAKVTLGAASPHVAHVTVRVGSAGTEQSQKVTVTVIFDRAVKVGAAALDDLIVRVDGQKLDSRTIVCSATQTGPDAMTVTIAAAPGDSGPLRGAYFALHDGRLTIVAKAASGGLAHVTSADGSLSARWRPINWLVPSGLKIALVSSAAGDAAAGRAATATLRVTRTPLLRVVSWLELAPQGARARVHNHEFLLYDRAGYATHLSTSLAASFRGAYTFAAHGDTVTVTATRVVEGRG